MMQYYTLTHTQKPVGSQLNLPLRTRKENKKLAPYGTGSRVLLTANFKVTWHKN